MNSVDDLWFGMFEGVDFSIDGLYLTVMALGNFIEV